MISLDGVTKSFRGATSPAVDGLTMTVAEGEIVILVGPSGCGKTTTLKMINRLVEPTSGSITIQGRDVLAAEPHDLRRSIGYVIQQIGLFPHRTIAQNIATVPELLGWTPERIRDRVTDLLDLMRLEASLRERYPHELSGGQRQRVGVARALAADPPVMLMDEPFGAVDPLVRAQLQELLLQLQDEVRKTIVFVTHDIDEAILLGDRVAILNVGGRLEQYDSPAEILARPANDFVSSFLGSERGLRRLGLLPVRDLDLVKGPVVEVSRHLDEARAAMHAAGTDWFGLLSGGRLLGWVWGEEATDDLTRLTPRPFAASVDAGASLREALDAIVTTRNNVAVVCDDREYLGMIFVDHIGRELAR